MELAKRCQTILDKAEQRITKLRESFAQAPAPSAAPANGEPAGELLEESALPLDEE